MRLYLDTIYINHRGPLRIPMLPAIFDWIFILAFQHKKIDILYGHVKIARTIYVNKHLYYCVLQGYFDILFVL